MNLQKLGANQTVLTFGTGTDFETQVLFSYNTPVAARTPAGNFKTSHKWSRTTSRHVNGFVGADAIERDQNFFDALVKAVQ